VPTKGRNTAQDDGPATGQDAAQGDGPLRHLGGMAVDAFVARYWQRRALCIRQAIAGFRNPIGVEALLALAAQAPVESRLITRRAGRWQLRHGPFDADDLPARTRRAWTLLVQGVDLHDAAVAALAARFRFLPVARFDDAMISYATDGGGVGPHVDQYDVFLLQAQGRRRWRIARRFDPAVVDGLPLRVLARFEHEHEWVLEPGDALYLPPGVAHEGVALGECLTISIGFRLPSWQEIGAAWHDRQSRLLDAVHPPEERLPDRTRRATRAPAQLPAGMIDAAAHELARRAPTRRETARTLLEQLSEPKDAVVFDPPRAPLAPARFARLAAARGVQLDLRTRMLFAGADVAINGEIAPAMRTAGPALRRLANERRLDGATLSLMTRTTAGGPAQAPLRAPSQTLPHTPRQTPLPTPLQVPLQAPLQALLPLLHDWYRAGWLHIAGI
jgi:50S ribosomal protein L16 3-hydroxylase